MIKPNYRGLTAALFWFPSVVACVAVAIAFRAPITTPATPVFRGVPVELWTFYSIILIPIFTVIWVQRLMSRRLARLADPALREELAPSLLQPSEFLSWHFQLPFVAMLVPSVISFPCLAANLRIITHPIHTFILPASKGGHYMLGYQEARARGFSWADFDLPADLQPKYDWNSLIFLFALALCVIVIAIGGQLASLARLCRRRSRNFYSRLYSILWVQVAALLPLFAALVLNLSYEPPYRRFGHQLPDCIPSPSSEIFLINMHSQIFIWTLTIACAGYAYFWWRRLCATYYRFE